ncbi:hypothetical protein [Kineococcus sp. G2]|uniref:hypothetical protein n=1 Tax=Kineococcus sp. G2 TaxID=3127484 RepID=UPI00301E1453
MTESNSQFAARIGPADGGGVPGVVIAGVTVDAGAQESPALLRVGTKSSRKSDPADPVTCGWDVSTGRNGVVVDGDDVSATGLFVEHYQQYDVVWNGERGRTFLFQDELPHDLPNQADWQHDGTLGWAAYEVADHVRHHELTGARSCTFMNVDPSLRASQGFEVPRTEGVRLRHLHTVNLTAGTLDSVVNGVGAPVTPQQAGQPSYVLDHPWTPGRPRGADRAGRDPPPVRAPWAGEGRGHWIRPLPSLRVCG